MRNILIKFKNCCGVCRIQNNIKTINRKQNIWVLLHISHF